MHKIVGYTEILQVQVGDGAAVRDLTGQNRPNSGAFLSSLRSSHNGETVRRGSREESAPRMSIIRAATG
jgi:hypothetical protein